MVRRNKNNKLAHWEIAIIKSMLDDGNFGNDQDILAYFTRPTRSINHRAIGEIRTGKKHSRVISAKNEVLQQFIDNWPQIDANTGLHFLGDELLIKSREAMLVAVQSYNNPKTHFRSEIFIVTSIIAWTYLLHAFYKKEKVDFRYKKLNHNGVEEIVKTRHGANKHWELDQCLSRDMCPLDEGTKNNLKFLIGIRHEIEHQMTSRIDSKLSAKLQACALNYNNSIKELFGKQYGLDGELSFAIQFSTIDPEQRQLLMEQVNLPAHIDTMRETFEADLTEEQYNDPKYAYRVIFVPKISNSKAQADNVVEFISAGTEEANDINAIYLKEIDKIRHRPKMIVDKMKEEGFHKFTIHDHTKLWQTLNAKNPASGYGVNTESDGWRWYDRWIDAVRQHCTENIDKYR